MTKIKNNFYIAIGALFIVGSSYFYFLSVVRAKQNLELVSAMSKLEALENTRANFSLNDRFLRDTLEEREKLNSFIINKQSVSDFIQRIEMIGKHANVEITKSLSVEKNPLKPKEMMLRFTARPKGNFGDVYYFTLLVENLPYKMRAKKISMGTSDADVSSVSGGVSAAKTKTTAPESVWSGEVNFEILGYINE